MTCQGLVRYLTALWLFAWAVGLGAGRPSGHGFGDGTLLGSNVSYPFGDYPALRKRQSGAKVPLRITPLGASIMTGLGSSTGNGLRKPLRDALRFDGWEVNMVGTFHDGNMVDYVRAESDFPPRLFYKRAAS
jgi:hypothetical protein